MDRLKRMKLVRKRSFAQKIAKEKLKSRKPLSAKERATKKKKVLWIILLTIFVVPVLSLLLWLGFSLARVMLTPFNEAMGSFPTDFTWNGNQQLNLLVIRLSEVEKKNADIKSLYLVQIDRENKNIRILEIPTDIDVEVARGMGEYRMSKVYALGAIADKKENVVLVRDTLGKNLAVSVDRYIAIDEEIMDVLTKIGFKLPSIPPKSSKSEQFNQIFQTNGHIISGIKGWFNIMKFKEYSQNSLFTNLKPQEYLLLVNSVGRMEVEKLSFSQFPEDFMVEEKIDEENHKRIDQVKSDFFIRNNFYDYLVRQEGMKIKVFNGTDFPQIAAKASRIVSNLGMEVIDLGNWDKVEENLIYVDSDYLNQASVKRLQIVFNCRIVTVKMGETERADIKLIIGNEWMRKMEGKGGKED